MKSSLISSYLLILSAACFATLHFLRPAPDWTDEAASVLLLVTAAVVLINLVSTYSTYGGRSKNQTKSLYLNDRFNSETGIGLFAVADPETPFGTRVVAVPDISYKESVARGQHTIAFKWIPSSISPIVVECPAKGQRCRGDCGHDFCICVQGRCVSPST